MTVPSRETADLPTEFAPFFANLSRSRLCFPACDGCESFHWYPLSRCPRCLSDAITWRAVAGNGTLYSWTVIRHPFDPDRAVRLPYTVALIEFPDAPGVRFVAELTNTPFRRPLIGMAVLPIFGRDAAGRPYVTFYSVPSSGSETASTGGHPAPSDDVAS